VAVLPRSVNIAVFYWFTVDHLSQLKVLIVGENINRDLSFIGVVWHCTLQQQNVAFFVNIQHCILHLSLREYDTLLDAHSRFVNHFDPHVFEEVLVGAVSFQVENCIGLRDLDFITGKQVVFAFWQWNVLQLVLLCMVAFNLLNVVEEADGGDLTERGGGPNIKSLGSIHTWLNPYGLLR